MRKLIYLVFEDGTIRASFTRDKAFHVEAWAATNNTLFQQIGVKKIEFEEVADDFYLPWESELG